VSGANPDLPILDELGAEFETLAEAELNRATHPERARLPRRTSRAGSARGARRVARRSAVVLVLLCLIGGVALAARFGGGGGSAHTSPATLGVSDALGWRLSAYRDRGRLCLAFTVGAELTSKCGPNLRRGELWAASALGGERRYVVGLAGAGVAAVEVRAGGSRAIGPARAPLDPDAARSAGLPARTRWFVVSVPRRRAGRAPARAFTLDGRNRRLGPAYLDCSLGVVGPCSHRIRSQAAGAS
jgi:hypothetical protein